MRCARYAWKPSFGVRSESPRSVTTMDFDDSGVKYVLRFFTEEFDKRDRVDGEARDRIWYAFHRAGIALPRLHRREHLLAGITAAAAPPLSASLIRRIVGGN